MGSFGHFYPRIAKIVAGRNFICMEKLDLHRVGSNHVGRSAGGSGIHLNQLNLSPLLEEIERADKWSVAYFLFCIWTDP